MNQAACLVAVDVGNSAVKLCLRQGGLSAADGDELLDHSIRIDESSWQTSAIHWVRDKLGCGITEWRVASVHRGAAEKLHQAICDVQPEARVFRITRDEVPMQVRVEHPDRLGIDRLLGAFAARNRFPTPLVVVDAGSAVTIDWVNDKGEFVGGAILPGLGLQAGALASGTDALPHVSWQQDQAVSIPPSNTTAAIRLGVLTAVSAAIDRLVDRYSRANRSAAACQLVLTGGDAAVISPHIEYPHLWVPNLVCRGLLDLPRST